MSKDRVYVQSGAMYDKQAEEALNQAKKLGNDLGFEVVRLPSSLKVVGVTKSPTEGTNKRKEKGK